MSEHELSLADEVGVAGAVAPRHGDMGASTEAEALNTRVTIESTMSAESIKTDG